MKFINNGLKVQVRENDGKGYKWTLLKNGEIIDLPEFIGESYGFQKVLGVPKISSLKGKIGKRVLETKMIDLFSHPFDDLFFKELIKIKGIGTKTAKDIVNWGTKEKLIRVIKKKESLPFRDDVEKKLRRKYGK